MGRNTGEEDLDSRRSRSRSCRVQKLIHQTCIPLWRSVCVLCDDSRMLVPTAIKVKGEHDAVLMQHNTRMI